MKDELRKQIRETLASLNPAAAHAKSMAACKRLMAQPEFARAETIMLYLPMVEEVDTTPLALRSWQDEKTVTAPRCAWAKRQMMPIEIRSMVTGLEVTHGEVRERVRRAGSSLWWTGRDGAVRIGLGGRLHVLGTGTPRRCP